MDKRKFLFEIGTEVCYKVGGIHTILQSKLEQTIKNFGDNYILIGPWRGKSLNKEFIESSDPLLDEAKKILAKKSISCYTGYWNTETKPKVILLKFKRHYKIRSLLDSLENNFGVDSSDSDIDYIRSILFSTTAGEAIEALAKSDLIKNKNILTHFHEWMCGAGLLHVKKHCKNVATIFTTHATVLGRFLAYDNLLATKLPKNFNTEQEAHKNKNVTFAKSSLEKITTQNADCFTTVSDITAMESKIILGRYPDKIIGNGLNIEQTLKKVNPKKTPKIRKKLIEIASKVTKNKISNDALLWITSGRYEFHNKGYDLLLKSLAKLKNELPKNSPPIIVFFLVALKKHTKKDSLINLDSSLHPEHQNAIGIATHKISHPNKDGIIKLCNELDLKDPNKKIHVVFSDAYLNGNDGVFDLTYKEILASCDLSIFPSFYEPWGYTPLESLAYSVPTITTNLAGFGSWIVSNTKSYDDSVFVLNRKEKNETESIDDLKEHLLTIIEKSSNKDHTNKIREKSLQIARLADWKNFYKGYMEAYKQAVITQLDRVTSK